MSMDGSNLHAAAWTGMQVAAAGCTFRRSRRRSSKERATASLARTCVHLAGAADLLQDLPALLLVPALDEGVGGVGQDDATCTAHMEIPRKQSIEPRELGESGRMMPPAGAARTASQIHVSILMAPAASLWGPVGGREGAVVCCPGVRSLLSTQRTQQTRRSLPKAHRGSGCRRARRPGPGTGASPQPSCARRS